MPFYLGLAGGHCIGVDPHYLTHRAEKAGYHPEVILAGRRINDNMGQRIALKCTRRLLRRGWSGAVVTVLGLTFKENVPDIRNSKGPISSMSCDHRVSLSRCTIPLRTPARRCTHMELPAGREVAAPGRRGHTRCRARRHVMRGWPLVTGLLKGSEGVVLDVKSTLNRATKPAGIELWRL